VSNLAWLTPRCLLARSSSNGSFPNSTLRLWTCCNTSYHEITKGGFLFFIVPSNLILASPNLCLPSNQRRWLMKQNLPPLISFLGVVSKLHLGHANLVCVFHPDKIPRLGKSLMVHNIAACISNTSLPYESKVLILVFHSSFNSSISGYKYTSISFPGARFPGMIMERMNELCSIHIQGGRLYGMSTIGQILWLVLRLPYGLNHP